MPVAAGPHRRQQRLVHPEHAEDVGVVHPPPLVDVGGLDRVEPEGAARAVHDDVDPVERRGQRRDGRVVGDVERQRPAADLGGQLLAALHPAGCGDGLEAGGRERPHGGRADPAARARDQGHPPVVRRSHGAHRTTAAGRVACRPCGSTSAPATAGPTRRRCVTNDRATILAGIGLWAVAFVVALLLHTRLEAAGRGWWIWTALAGVGLGLLGLLYMSRRPKA